MQISHAQVRSAPVTAWNQLANTAQTRGDLKHLRQVVIGVADDLSHQIVPAGELPVQAAPPDVPIAFAIA